VTVQQFDVAVVGAGIAGLTAGLVTARLGRKTLVLTGAVLGGQLLSIEKVDGYPGFPDGIAGYDLCPMVHEQAENVGAEFVATEVERLEPSEDCWRLVSGEGDFAARAVLLATGCSLKKLGIPGEERLTGRGVSHCATCDAPLLRNRPVVVVGGGDSALQEALTLGNHASRVTIVEQRAALTGQVAYQNRLRSSPKIEIRCNTTIEEIIGSEKVTAVRIRGMTNGTTSELEAAGVFVYIGLTPNTKLVERQLGLDSCGAILMDAWMRTGTTGVFAAGTVRSNASARAVSSAGDGATAAIAIDRYLASGIWCEQRSDDAIRHLTGGSNERIVDGPRSTRLLT